MLYECAPEAITESSRAGGRWSPERYGRQRYREETKETEAEQRHRRGGDRREKIGGDMKGSRVERERYMKERGRGETYERDVEENRGGA